MVPNALLFMITQTTAMSSSNAVASDRRVLAEAAVADSATTTGPGSAIFAPSAAGAPKPIVAKPPGVKIAARRVDRELLAHAVLVPAHVGAR